jgi:hypothetical protein
MLEHLPALTGGRCTWAGSHFVREPLGTSISREQREQKPNHGEGRRNRSDLQANPSGKIEMTVRTYTIRKEKP